LQAPVSGTSTRPRALRQRSRGPGAYAAYRAGAIKLEDVAGWSHSAKWGRTPRVKSLRELVGAEEARKWLALSRQPDPATVIEGVRITDERRQHWRVRHPEITGQNETDLIRRGLQETARVRPSQRDAETELRYFQDDAGKWWVLKVARPPGSSPFVLTLHRVHKPGK